MKILTAGSLRSVTAVLGLGFLLWVLLREEEESFRYEGYAPLNGAHGEGETYIIPESSYAPLDAS